MKQIFKYGFMGCLFAFITLGIFPDAVGPFGRNLKEPLGKLGVWKLEREQAGIRVFSLSKPAKGALVFRTDTIVNSSLDSLLAVIIDIDNYVNWIPGGKGSKTLTQISETEYIGYVIVDIGRFFSDRDFVVRAKGFQNPESKNVSILYTSIDGYLPKLKHTVRIDDNQGFWILAPLEKNRVHLTWQGRLDPGGWFPTWLLRMLFDTVVLKTMQDITEEVKKEKYQDIIFNGFK
jgi:hypothetical protein